jgi:hypothetical protein
MNLPLSQRTDYLLFLFRCDRLELRASVQHNVDSQQFPSLDLYFSVDTS